MDLSLDVWQGRFIPTPVGNTDASPRSHSRSPVHPHARGEHDFGVVDQQVFVGSSPRPWGTPQAEPRQAGGRRFIPTPVGNTPSDRSRSRSTAVHPHARGEHDQVWPVCGSTYGSSPRPWGTLYSVAIDLLEERFIPTPVGNTISGSLISRCSSVHPHARGEHRRLSHGKPAVGGSSPRPWGTPHVRRACADPSRFIPTPVGNTFVRWHPAGKFPVHPHARGEHMPATWPASDMAGSSPRPWGTLGARRDAVPGRRFIPTPVGNTTAQGQRAGRGTVHPHARGEHDDKVQNAPSYSGSSPRPWGTPARDGRRPVRARFIPTPVGNTSGDRRRAGPRAVHPHARGEHDDVVLAYVPRGGSSPRPWGTRQARPPVPTRCRFIPTPVGNTLWRWTRVAGRPVHPHARGEHPPFAP